MKNILKTIALVFVVSVLFTACKKDEKTSTKATTTKVVANQEYQCPMKCEGEKTYKDKGTCPVCKMDLKKVAKKEQP